MSNGLRQRLGRVALLVEPAEERLQSPSVGVHRELLEVTPPDFTKVVANGVSVDLTDLGFRPRELDEPIQHVAVPTDGLG
jgi:hypothetical protein